MFDISLVGMILDFYTFKTALIFYTNIRETPFGPVKIILKKSRGWACSEILLVVVKNENEFWL